MGRRQNEQTRPGHLERSERFETGVLKLAPNGEIKSTKARLALRGKHGTSHRDLGRRERRDVVSERRANVAGVQSPMGDMVSITYKNAILTRRALACGVCRSLEDCPEWSWRNRVRANAALDRLFTRALNRDDETEGYQAWLREPTRP